MITERQEYQDKTPYERELEERVKALTARVESLEADKFRMAELLNWRKQDSASVGGV